MRRPLFKLGSALWRRSALTRGSSGFAPVSRCPNERFPGLWAGRRSFCSRSNHPPQNRNCLAYVYRDLVPFATAWAWQKQLMNDHVRRLPDGSPPPDDRDLLLVLEHPPVYTLGRRNTHEYLQFNPENPPHGAEVYATERGGKVTCHEPGQLVVYPILDLNRYKKDLHWYLRRLEDVILLVLSKHGIEGNREDAHTGIWVQGKKVAAIGINSSRWITMHGFALNVTNDLKLFDEITACGIEGRGVCSLKQLVPGVEMDTVRNQVLEAFSEVFQVPLTLIPGCTPDTSPVLDKAAPPLGEVSRGVS